MPLPKDEETKTNTSTVYIGKKWPMTKHYTAIFAVKVEIK
jgi:hypothetical protein